MTDNFDEIHNQDKNEDLNNICDECKDIVMWSNLELNACKSCILHCWVIVDQLEVVSGNSERTPKIELREFRNGALATECFQSEEEWEWGVYI